MVIKYMYGYLKYIKIKESNVNDIKRLIKMI
jgi:hypothetical protein